MIANSLLLTVFLQHILNSFQIVPILIPNDSLKTVKELSHHLADALKGRNALLVGSTDLCHYPVYEEAVRSDKVVVEALSRFDVNDLEQTMNEYMRTNSVDQLHCMMCSTGAVYTAIETAQLLGADSMTVLNAANSGDVPGGRKDEVVGYASAMMYRAP